MTTEEALSIPVGTLIQVTKPDTVYAEVPEYQIAAKKWFPVGTTFIVTRPPDNDERIDDDGICSIPVWLIHNDKLIPYNGQYSSYWLYENYFTALEIIISDIQH